jgi:hypothetical protein
MQLRGGSALGEVGCLEATPAWAELHMPTPPQPLPNPSPTPPPAPHLPHEVARAIDHAAPQLAPLPPAIVGGVGAEDEQQGQCKSGEVEALAQRQRDVWPVARQRAPLHGGRGNGGRAGRHLRAALALRALPTAKCPSASLACTRTSTASSLDASSSPPPPPPPPPTCTIVSYTPTARLSAITAVTGPSSWRKTREENMCARCLA